MKVVVCVESWGLSAASRAALALAARLAPAAEIVALSATDTNATEALTEAQRLGARRAVQVMEMAFEGLDVGALGKTLADVVRAQTADLVLCGARSDGEGRGVVPAAIAHHLGVPYVPYIEELSVAGGEATVLVRSGGRKRRLAVALPCVLTTGAGLALPAPAPASASAIETVKPDATMRTVGRTSDLGALDKPKRKPAAATSASDLLRRWLDG
jgi:electron transfer flavoprotein beta subunit